MLSPDSNLSTSAGARARADQGAVATRPGFSTLAQDARAPEPAVTAAVTERGVRRLLSILTSAQRKEYPITSGVVDYFPDALAMVAHVSYMGNQKHNPGQPLHWARSKSMDHEDCILRHTIERDVVEDGVLHAANRAWRALASLQEMLEAKFDLDPPRGATDLIPRKPAVPR